MSDNARVNQVAGVVRVRGSRGEASRHNYRVRRNLLYQAIGKAREVRNQYGHLVRANLEKNEEDGPLIIDEGQTNDERLVSLVCEQQAQPHQQAQAQPHHQAQAQPYHQAQPHTHIRTPLHQTHQQDQSRFQALMPNAQLNGPYTTHQQRWSTPNQRRVDGLLDRVMMLEQELAVKHQLAATINAELKAVQQRQEQDNRQSQLIISQQQQIIQNPQQDIQELGKQRPRITPEQEDRQRRTRGSRWRSRSRSPWSQRTSLNPTVQLDRMVQKMRITDPKRQLPAILVELSVKSLCVYACNARAHSSRTLVQV